MKDEIEEQIDKMVGDGERPFEKLKCPKCQKSAVCLSFPTTEWEHRMAKLMETDKIPKTRRLRFELRCPYCAYVCCGQENLKKDGIEPEIEIS